jgi:DNA invertase Pin-like site-specific DNA recombinase
MKNRRALLYIRVSTEKQVQKGISLDTQEERCREYAKEAGYLVGAKDVFVDAGESARTTARPALIDLMERCRKEAAIKAVVVYDISRLARNRLDFALIKQVLQKEGVTLLSATEPIDETPEGQMLEGVLSTVAEFFSAQNARKVKANMEKKARSGGWPNLAPFGYRNRKEKLASGQVTSRIEPDPNEAPWVRRAFRDFATGEYSVKALARRLEGEGIPVRANRNRTTRRFHQSHLDRMLRKRIYIGLIDWGDVEGAKGSHKPLVSASLFYRVQDLLALRAGAVSKPLRHFSPLKAISVCASCASRMTLDLTETTARTIRYFRCRKRQAGATVACRESYHEEERYLEKAGELLRAVELPPKIVAKVQRRVESLVEGDAAAARRRKRELERELAKIRERKKKLILRGLDLDDDSDIYREVKRELDAEEAVILERIKESEKAGLEVAALVAKAAEVAGAGGRAFQQVENVEVRYLLLRAIFTRLELARGRIVRATLNPLFQFFEKPTRIAEIPLAFPVESFLSCAPGGIKVEAGQSCQDWQLDDVSAVVADLPPDLVGVIDECHTELVKRGIITPRHKKF